MVWLGVVVGILAGGGGTAKPDFTFGTPTNLGPVVNSQYDEQMPSISGDGLELYFMSRRPGGFCNWDIWVSKRASLSDPWGEPVNLGPKVNSSIANWAPCISADGLELYIEANRSGNLGGTDIWVAVRKTRDEPWGDPVNLGPTVNSPNRDGGPSISADGLELYFKSLRPGRYGYEDLWVSKRPTKDEPWGSPVNIGQTINSPDLDREPSISGDGLVLCFTSDRLNGARGWDFDIWLTTRHTNDSAWAEPVNLGPSINTTYEEDAPSVSADGRTLYFSEPEDRTFRLGGHGAADIWQAPIIPIVDFNSDGKVDIQDLLRLIQSWGKDDPAVDMGPMPWGDGKVDAKDLEVLMSYWGQNVDDPTLVGHWPLDETDGTTAHDRAGGNDGTLIGLPQWRPQGGTMGGALELNGKTFVAAKSAINPAKGSFSIVAWIKGGAPGQTLVSQQGAANWLLADAQGALATGLSQGGRTSAGLSSPTLITDGNWHRIAFTWDGTNRRLYVDGVLAAEDTQEGLADSSGQLILGAGKNMAPGTFWSGLIDDVRVYDRAVKP
jgi:hypothetical protein